MKKGCELCELKPLTKWYWKSEASVICDCLSCGTPMVVFREHGEKARPLYEYGAEQVCRWLFGKRFRGFRKKMRTIKDHCHWHLLLEDE